jgi:DnaJ-class molecular chaperone
MVFVRFSGNMCPDCGGTGKYVGLNLVETCQACNGTGVQ